MDNPNSRLTLPILQTQQELSIGELQLREIDNQAIVSLSYSEGERASIDRLCQSSLNTELPQIGHITYSESGLKLLGMQYEQVWCCFEQPTGLASQALQARMQHTENLYLTDQGDGWCTLALSGEHVLQVLERLCPLNLSMKHFALHTVARTAIEHVGSVIQRTGDTHFEILIPRSYTRSFFHAVENVAGHIHSEQTLPG